MEDLCLALTMLAWISILPVRGHCQGLILLGLCSMYCGHILETPEQLTSLQKLCYQYHRNLRHPKFAIYAHSTPFLKKKNPTLKMVKQPAGTKLMPLLGVGLQRQFWRQVICWQSGLHGKTLVRGKKVLQFFWYGLFKSIGPNNTHSHWRGWSPLSAKQLFLGMTCYSLSAAWWLCRGYSTHFFNPKTLA